MMEDFLGVWDNPQKPKRSQWFFTSVNLHKSQVLLMEEFENIVVEDWKF